MIESLFDKLHALYDIPALINWGGMFILVAIVFAETGLLIGFLLPGDSLLITAGLFAAGGYLNLYQLLGYLSLAAIVGDSVGYLIGRKAGKMLFKREDSFLFKKAHLLKAQAFYKKHGGKAIVLARFVPIVRTFAPVVAGAAEMDYKKFAMFNIFGGIFWVFSMTLTGFFLAKSFPGVVKNLETIIISACLISIIPILWELYKEKNKKIEEDISID